MNCIGETNLDFSKSSVEASREKSGLRSRFMPAFSSRLRWKKQEKGAFASPSKP
jgi:hypothetical protein